MDRSREDGRLHSALPRRSGRVLVVYASSHCVDRDGDETAGGDAREWSEFHIGRLYCDGGADSGLNGAQLDGMAVAQSECATASFVPQSSLSNWRLRT